MSVVEHQSADQAEAKAKENGLVVKYPLENELFLDIDCVEDREIFKVACQNFMNGYEGAIQSWTETPSASGEAGHSHIIVVFKEALTSEKRILLQALFGSDRKREIVSLRRLWEDNNPCPTLFFEKPPEAPRRLRTKTTSNFERSKHHAARSRTNHGNDRCRNRRHVRNPPGPPRW